jgi:hypothetical protein
MDFEIVGDITQPETFARGSGIRELARLRKVYGLGNWRKRKGFARVRLSDGVLRDARSSLVRGGWPRQVRVQDQTLHGLMT